MDEPGNNWVHPVPEIILWNLEWLRLAEKDAVLGIDAGTYVGLLSHSGSRALGANIANHYTKIAISKRRLPREAKNLAWLTSG